MIKLKDNPIDGVNIRMSGQDFIVPPLNFRQLKVFRSLINNISTGKAKNMTEDQTESLIKVVHAAMTRNYPDITMEEVEELIDLKNMMPVVNAVMNVSGLVTSAEKLMAGEQETP